MSFDLTEEQQMQLLALRAQFQEITGEDDVGHQELFVPTLSTDIGQAFDDYLKSDRYREKKMIEDANKAMQAAAAVPSLATVGRTATAAAPRLQSGLASRSKLGNAVRATVDVDIDDVDDAQTSRSKRPREDLATSTTSGGNLEKGGTSSLLKALSSTALQSAKGNDVEEVLSRQGSSRNWSLRNSLKQGGSTFSFGDCSEEEDEGDDVPGKQSERWTEGLSEEEQKEELPEIDRIHGSSDDESSSDSESSSSDSSGSIDMLEYKKRLQEKRKKRKVKEAAKKAAEAKKKAAKKKRDQKLPEHVIEHFRTCKKYWSEVSTDPFKKSPPPKAKSGEPSRSIFVNLGSFEFKCLTRLLRLLPPQVLSAAVSKGSSVDGKTEGLQQPEFHIPNSDTVTGADQWTADKLAALGCFACSWMNKGKMGVDPSHDSEGAFQVPALDFLQPSELIHTLSDLLIGLPAVASGGKKKSSSVEAWLSYGDSCGVCHCIHHKHLFTMQLCLLHTDSEVKNWPFKLKWGKIFFREDATKPGTHYPVVERVDLEILPSYCTSSVSKHTELILQRLVQSATWLIREACDPSPSGEYRQPADGVVSDYLHEGKVMHEHPTKYNVYDTPEDALTLINKAKGGTFAADDVQLNEDIKTYLFRETNPNTPINFIPKTYQVDTMAWMFNRELDDSEDNKEYRTIRLDPAKCWREELVEGKGKGKLSLSLTASGHIDHRHQPPQVPGPVELSKRLDIFPSPTLYYHPFTGQTLLRNAYDDELDRTYLNPPIRGGILGSKMGTGKTLCVLGLVHLNPCPSHSIASPVLPKNRLPRESTVVDPLAGRVLLASAKKVALSKTNLKPAILAGTKSTSGSSNGPTQLQTEEQKTLLKLLHFHQSKSYLNAVQRRQLKATLIAVSTAAIVGSTWLKQIEDFCPNLKVLKFYDDHRFYNKEEMPHKFEEELLAADVILVTFKDLKNLLIQECTNQIELESQVQKLALRYKSTIDWEHYCKKVFERVEEMIETLQSKGKDPNDSNAWDQLALELGLSDGDELYQFKFLHQPNKILDNYEGVNESTVERGKGKKKGSKTTVAKKVTPHFLLKNHFHRIVFDECQNLSNNDLDFFELITATSVWHVSGTPLKPDYSNFPLLLERVGVNAYHHQGSGRSKLSRLFASEEINKASKMEGNRVRHFYPSLAERRLSYVPRVALEGMAALALVRGGTRETNPSPFFDSPRWRFYNPAVAPQLPGILRKLIDLRIGADCPVADLGTSPRYVSCLRSGAPDEHRLSELVDPRNIARDLKLRFEDAIQSVLETGGVVFTMLTQYVLACAMRFGGRGPPFALNSAENEKIRKLDRRAFTVNKPPQGADDDAVADFWAWQEQAADFENLDFDKAIDEVFIDALNSVRSKTTQRSISQLFESLFPPQGGFQKVNFRSCTGSDGNTFFVLKDPQVIHGFSEALPSSNHRYAISKPWDNFCSLRPNYYLELVLSKYAIHHLELEIPDVHYVTHWYDLHDKEAAIYHQEESELKENVIEKFNPASSPTSNTAAVKKKRTGGAHFTLMRATNWLTKFVVHYSMVYEDQRNAAGVAGKSSDTAVLQEKQEEQEAMQLSCRKKTLTETLEELLIRKSDPNTSQGPLNKLLAKLRPLLKAAGGEESDFPEQEDEDDETWDCPVCGCEFDDADCVPVIMCCNHALCRTCLISMVQQQKKEARKCPLCHEPAPLHRPKIQVLFPKGLFSSEASLPVGVTQSDLLEGKALENSKFEHLFYVLESVIWKKEKGAKIVVFSDEGSRLLKKVKSYLETYTNQVGIADVIDSGSSVVQKRSEVIRKFQDPDSVMKVLLVATKIGNAGITLTMAHHLIFLEPSLRSEKMEKQAVGRVVRLGQMHEVTVHRLAARNTIEERTIKLLNCENGPSQRAGGGKEGGEADDVPPQSKTAFDGSPHKKRAQRQTTHQQTTAGIKQSFQLLGLDYDDIMSH